jgi:hypothetical protein
MSVSYFAMDGNYGDADGIVLVETSTFSESEWTEIEEASDHERANLAVEISDRHKPEPDDTENLDLTKEE